ncbi:tetratricopeptide repeat protein [Undibacterium sp. SXout7W]|uniref:tetratricopeptide repeat protein n=1 Tax=Undibacterium sp. SXout7W TaxID=3413049 RepID=UPI003BF2A5DD
MTIFNKIEIPQTILRLLGSFMICLFSSLPAQAQSSMSEELYLDALKAIHEQRNQDAKEILGRLIAIEPQHAGALLDLAIIQCELGNTKEANQLFNNIIERFSPAPAILEIITQHQTQGCNKNSINQRFSVLVERGIDSNVNQGASNPNFTLGTGITQIDLQLLPEYLPKKDRFSAISIDYLRELSPGSTVGFAQLRTRQFDELSQFNTMAIGIGVEHPLKLGEWNVSQTAMLGALTLNSHLYQTQQLLQTRIMPPIKLPESIQWSLVGGVTRTQYPTLAGYDANTWELKSLLNYQKNSYRVYFSTAYLMDRANGNRVGGHRSGSLISVQGRGKINSAVFGELGWTYQHWQNEQVYSPGLIDQARNQHTRTIRAALSFPIKENHSLQLEIKQVSNRENISLFEFNSKVLQVSWLWQGF